MKTLTLRTANDDYIDLYSLLKEDTKVILDYFFSLRQSWAIAVLDQINNSKLYDKFFTGKKYKTVIDLGAHIGLFSLCVKDSCETIHCVEPTKIHFDILNLLTEKYDNIKKHYCAISNYDGKAEFFECSTNNTQNSLLKQGNLNRGEIASLGTVDCFSLLTFLNNNNIEKVDFLKIDIEGGEQILFDDPNLGWLKDRVKIIFVEIHNIENGKYANPPEVNKNILLAKLKKLGYTTKVYNDAIYAEC